MAYTNVQFIGYVLDTSPKINPDGSKTYLGLSDPALDIEARCNVMLRAMQTARDALPQTSPPASEGETLKVFMAPEFFFRGASGAYPMDDVQHVVAELQRMAADEQWVDWVFVFGTIVGASSATPQRPPYDIDPLASTEVYSFAPVQQGGSVAQVDAGVRMLMKELMSGVAYIAAAANAGGLLVGDALHGFASAGAGREPQNATYDGAGVFDLAGMTWGLEVCPHHSETERSLQRSPQLPGEKLIQLQLVPSCGMGVQASSILAQAGGFVFNCDGSGSASHSTLVQQVQPVVEVPMLSSTPVSDDAVVLQSSSPVLEVAMSDLYSGGAGVVNVYPVQPLPAPQLVPGHTVRLDWLASPDYRFVFQLVYSTSGRFVTLVCEIQSKKVNFYGNNYFLPLALRTQDASKQNVRIQMRLAEASGPYAGAVWCRIDVPGFIFEGNAFEFGTTYEGPEPFTIW